MLRKHKVHLDGYNNLDLWTGKSEKSARREVFYYDETGLMADGDTRRKQQLTMENEEIDQRGEDRQSHNDQRPAAARFRNDGEICNQVVGGFRA